MTTQGTAGGSPARRTNVTLSIAGTDVTKHLTPDLISFEHSDDVEKNADTITIRLSDAQHKYLREWTIDKGTEIIAKIQTQDWAKPGEKLQVDCGSFYVDRIDYGSNPSVVEIKATSIPVSSTLKSVVKNNAWENQTIKQIAEQIARESGMTLDYRAKENPVMARCDQDEESDGTLLMRLATDAGLCLKVQKKTIILFDEAALDAQEPWITITRDVQPIMAWRLKTSSNRTVRGMKTAYMNPESGKVVGAEFVPDNPPEGVTGIDFDNERPLDMPMRELDGSGDIEAEEITDIWGPLDLDPRGKTVALKRAKSLCRKRNKAEWEIELVVPGSVEWVAGTVVRFDNTWGPKFGDANFLIRRAVHRIDRANGYVCHLSLRKVLKGY